MENERKRSAEQFEEQEEETVSLEKLELRKSDISKEMRKLEGIVYEEFATATGFCLIYLISQLYFSHNNCLWIYQLEDYRFWFFS